jgi:anti-sigma regulatory factor (Ser/Thr protein kinase)
MEIASWHRAVDVNEPSQPSAARYLVHELAHSAGFDRDDVHRAGLVATELGTNLVKHARGGQLLARAIAAAPAAEIELVAIDHGPGMRDVRASLVDGHSTAGSAGTGLGAVRRLGDMFDVYSDEHGTVITVLLRSRRLRAAPPSSRFEAGGLSVAQAGEDFCGDAWTIRHDRDGIVLLVVDGLGHGVHAFEAATAVLQAFRARTYPGNTEALQAMHAAVRHTRGAAAAIADVRQDATVLRYAGLGNISMTVVTDGAARHGVSHNGTLGHDVRVIREYTYPWVRGATIVMHSDGLKSHWNLDAYPGLRRCHPTTIAAVIYRDHNRGRDDVTIVVAREAA